MLKARGTLYIRYQCFDSRVSFFSRVLSSAALSGWVGARLCCSPQVIELLAAAQGVIRYVLVFPEGGGTAAHVPDAGDTIDDSIGMRRVAGAAPGLEQFRVGGGCFLAGVGFAAVVHADGILRVEVAHLAIFYIDAGYAVACGGHDEGVVKAHICRSGGDGPVPVNIAAAQAQVPFADGGGAVVRLLREGPQRGGFVARGRSQTNRQSPIC